MYNLRNIPSVGGMFYLIETMEMATKSKSKVTAEEIGGLLFGIHEHIEHKDGTDDIIYYEKDIIKLLVKLGFPKPVWGKNIAINKFKMK